MIDNSPTDDKLKQFIVGQDYKYNELQVHEKEIWLEHSQWLNTFIQDFDTNQQAIAYCNDKK